MNGTTVVPDSHPQRRCSAPPVVSAHFTDLYKMEVVEVNRTVAFHIGTVKSHYCIAPSALTNFQHYLDDQTSPVRAGQCSSSPKTRRISTLSFSQTTNWPFLPRGHKNCKSLTAMGMRVRRWFTINMLRDLGTCRCRRDVKRPSKLSSSFTHSLADILTQALLKCDNRSHPWRKFAA